MLGRWVVLRMEMQGVKHSDTIGYRKHLQRGRSVFKTGQRSGIFSFEGYISPSFAERPSPHALAVHEI